MDKYNDLEKKAGITNERIVTRETESLNSDESGCKESQFYSLPFGQAVASMY